MNPQNVGLAVLLGILVIYELRTHPGRRETTRLISEVKTTPRRQH